MKKFTVSCEVTYRRTWTGIEANTAEEAQELVFGDGGEIEHEEELVSGPCGADDLDAQEEVAGA